MTQLTKFYDHIKSIILYYQSTINDSIRFPQYSFHLSTRKAENIFI